MKQQCLDIKALLDNGNKMLNKAKQLKPGLILDKKVKLIINKLNEKYNV